VSLRARLTIALIALALLPTAVYTVFTLDQLGRSAERWFRPGVNRALTDALEVTQTTLARVEAVALSQADALADRFPEGPRSEPERAAMRVALRAAGLDFIQVYRRANGRWVLREQFTPPGILAPGAPDLGAGLGASLDSGRVVHSTQGALAALAPIGREGALAVGIWVPPDFFAQVEDVGLGASRYGQLGVLVALQREYVWILVSLLVVVLVLLAIALAAALARGMSRPLAELTAAFERVAAGDLAARIRPGGARELRTLGEGFNAMTAGLEAARDSLKTAEREAAWREVARRLAHEFKNVLTPMSLSLHRLGTRVERVPEDQRVAVRDSLAALSRGVDQMARLAEQFSQYARLPDPRFEPLDLTETTRAAAAMHEHEGVQVAIEPGPPLMVRGDSLLLSRAIHNLLLNACEASPAGSRVEVRTFAAEAQAVLEILDQGPGVPAELGNRVFEPYVSTKKRSSGLGLALVRDIATQHQGEVTLDNREAGGARARLSLPLLEEGGPAAGSA
jgi:nitrogen fixation/metabolism regulation signal transduction histidine kinase